MRALLVHPDIGLFSYESHFVCVFNELHYKTLIMNSPICVYTLNPTEEGFLSFFSREQSNKREPQSFNGSKVVLYISILREASARYFSMH